MYIYLDICSLCWLACLLYSMVYMLLVLRLQILVGTNFSVFVRQHVAGIKFSILYISFGANGIIISDFRSTFVMFYI